MLADDGERLSASAAGGDDAIAGREGNLHRFFKDDVLARFESRDGPSGVHAAGRAEADDIHGRIFQKIVLIGVDIGHGEFFRDGASAIGEDIGDGDQLGAVDLIDGGGMRWADRSASDDTEANSPTLERIFGHRCSCDSGHGRIGPATGYSRLR